MSDALIQNFKTENKKEGLRVFVAGGSRSGNDEIYIKEAYQLGRKIIKMDFRLDFGLSNRGIMGAVAQGVLDGFEEKEHKKLKSPISGITTKEYIKYYENEEILQKLEEVVIAKSLEERKIRLLNADFVVFAPGGVGTLDELAYDCVAMQDGLLDVKPFIIYNIDGFFHHLLEFLKEISAFGFADPVPFIVVDNNFELGVVFRLLKIKYNEHKTKEEAYKNARQLIYELPYFIKRKADSDIWIEDIIEEMHQVSLTGNAADRIKLADEIEQAYLEKEISRMYERLARSGKDTAVISEKLSKLKTRRL